MASGRYNPPSDVVAFATEWEAELSAAVGNRMRAVGVPDELIGIKGMPFEDSGAFVRGHAIGGANNNIPGRGIVGDGPGINVDLAALDVRFTQMSKVTCWASASLKDRVDAVIAHEFTEVGAEPFPGLSPHQRAIKFAPETTLKITDRARQILREIRRLEGLE